MDIIKSYKDLCNEIEIWEERLKTYIVQWNAIAKLGKLEGPQDITGIDYTQPFAKGTSQIGFEEALEMLGKIESHINLHKETIASMEEARKQIEERIEKLEGLDMKVVYMRDIEGMALADIAEKLGYSEIYIKKISARNKRVY